MKKRSRVWRLCALASMVLASSLATTSPAEAAPEDFTTICPEMTDSVYRLYTAVFLREPDQAGFDGWVDNYAAQGWHLLRIAQFFTESPEFQERYGSLTDAEFIDLIYQNVLGRLPDSDGRQFWLNELANGLTRGGLLLFFSESEEYVLATGTFDPLAGYLRSYSPTTVWGCGLADHAVWSPSPRRYWDLFMDNQSGGDIIIQVSFLDAAGDVIRTGPESPIPAGRYIFQWNMDAGDIDPAHRDTTHGVRFDVIGDETDVYVIAVGTDRLMPPDRPSWEGQNGVVNKASVLFPAD